MDHDGSDMQKNRLGFGRGEVINSGFDCALTYVR